MEVSPRARSSLSFLIPIFALFLLLFVLQPFDVFLLNTAFIYCIFALSLDFLMGYGGMPNFGQAVFFGLGAYITVMAQIWWNVPWILSLFLPYVVVLPLCVVLAYVSVGRGGIYFAMITLIWGDIIYRVFFYEWTLGGSDGLRGAQIFPLQPYYVALLISLIMCYVLLKKMVNSQFGKALQGIRENEERMRFVGCNVEKYKILAFMVSACFATFAGSLYPGMYGGARPELLHWTLSTLAVVMIIVGGLGTLIGALFGGLMMTLIIEWATSYLPMGGGFTIVGLILVTVLFVMPKGVYPTMRTRIKRVISRS